MFRTLLDHSYLSSMLFLAHWPSTSTQQTGLLFGRFAEQSPLASSEPNAPVTWDPLLSQERDKSGTIRNLSLTETVLKRPSHT